jgi:hypothetical protein
MLVKDSFIAYLRGVLHSRHVQRGDYPFTYDFLLVTPEMRDKYMPLLKSFEGTVEDAEKVASSIDKDFIKIKDGDMLPKEIVPTKLKVVKVNQDSITVKYIE